MTIYKKGDNQDGMPGMIGTWSQSNIGCIECHMPRVSKSAIKTGKFAGDVRTHIFKVNTKADGKLFYREGKKTYAVGAVTLAFVCLNCHQSRDMKWAAKYATKVH